MFHDEVGTNSAVTDNSVSEKKKKGGERDKGNINHCNLRAVRNITDFRRPCLWERPLPCHSLLNWDGHTTCRAEAPTSGGDPDERSAGQT